MANKEKTLAGRITRKLVVWLFIIVIGISFLVFYFASRITHDIYAETYLNRTLITLGYTRRVLSDVYVAVKNNIFYLEQDLDKPDQHKKVMERIVSNGTRIRSCGISFIKDYYPEKGHQFCPYAWRNAKNPDVIETIDMGDEIEDYLDADWFHAVIDTDSAHWSEPFFDGTNKKTTLTAYMEPIHDKDGRVVAALGADVSLDWLTWKLQESDSTITAKAHFMSRIIEQASTSFIINHDGTFITHPDEKLILKDNIFNHVKESHSSQRFGMVDKLKRGVISDQEETELYIYDGQKCYVFYTPVKFTNWIFVTIVPSDAIDKVGIINGSILLVFIALVILLFIAICRYYMKRETEPLKQMIRIADDISKRKLDTPVPEINHNDELRQLATSFENMQETLSCYIQEKKS